MIGGGLLKSWTFDKTSEGWQARHQCRVKIEDGKSHVNSAGNDPIFGTSVHGPAGSYRLVFRARFEDAGQGQLFWQTDAKPNEAAERSATFPLQ